MAPDADPWVLRREPMHAVIARVRAALAGGAAAVTLRVLDPDAARGRYAGEVVEVAGEAWVHRPWRAWLDLAERLGLRMLTPRAVPGTPCVDVRYERLGEAAPGAGEAADADVTERYGAASPFARIAKAEDPGFVVDLADALARVAASGALPAVPRLLDLGVNDGDELGLIVALCPALAAADVVGVDHSASALAAARAAFPRGRFVEADLATLGAGDPHALGRFDLVVSFGTLQSGGLDDRALLRAVVQQHLAPRGALVLGLPNCRYVDGEVEHGARMRNFRQAELGLLVKDVAFYRKYLQQHHRRVFVTGKHEVLVTAVPGPVPDRPAAG